MIIVHRIESRQSKPGPAEYFTGSVRIEPLIENPEPSRIFGASVSFEAKARTAWHTHPVGQTLIVTEGVGWVQMWGEALQEIRKGDVVWIPPAVKHWHGAGASAAMTHIAIVEKLDGKGVEWLEFVDDEQYPN